jgi:putative ABC transport system permease protein
MPLAVLLLRRFSLRHWRLAPGQNALLVFILSLGVAVFIAIRLANQAAVASFSNFTDILVGQSDWIIEPPVGTLPQSVLPELRSALGDRPVTVIPVVETDGGAGNTIYTVLGLDLVGISNLTAARPAAGKLGAGGGDFWNDLRPIPRVWVGPRAARDRNLYLVIGDRPLFLPVAGAIPTIPGGPPPPENLVVMDLPELQRLAGRPGRLDRVEFLVAAGPREDQRRAELGEILTRLGRDGERWTVRTPGARRETAAKMTAAFRLNLTILSLIALLVGLYLIFQALDGAVVRRRGEIAILRSLGVDEGAIRAVWLLEAAALGVMGGVAGLGLGWLAAQAAVRAVGRTVNALYYATTVHSATLRASDAWLALGLGVGASVLAGWWPAREAAQTPPAQILARPRALGPGLWRSPWRGAGAIAVGLLLIRLPPVRLASGARFPLAGYAAALAWIIGGGIICAAALPVLSWPGRWLGRRSGAARIANGHLAHPSGRHRLAVAALLCAVGMSAGMAILISSFERTVRLWMARSLQADLYVSSAGAHSSTADVPIPAATWRALGLFPGVGDSWILATFPLQLGTGAPTLLTGTNLGMTRTHSNLPWVEAPIGDAVFDPARNGALALVSESFAERFERRRGDLLSFPTPAGRQTVTIAGVFADYGNERGSILVQQERLAEWMGDASATHVSLFARPGVNPDALRLALRRNYPGLTVLSQASLRDHILRVFRQTFAITYALEVIGVAVAVVGLALAMASVLLDRRDELTTLRALGFSRAELAWAGSLEGLAVALWAIGGGILLSLALGWLLIHVINKQSFGWTLSSALPGGQLAGLAAAVTVTGWAVSYGVGLWGANLPADQEE